MWSPPPPPSPRSPRDPGLHGAARAGEPVDARGRGGEEGRAGGDARARARGGPRTGAWRTARLPDARALGLAPPRLASPGLSAAAAAAPGRPAGALASHLPAPGPERPGLARAHTLGRPSAAADGGRASTGPGAGIPRRVPEPGGRAGLLPAAPAALLGHRRRPPALGARAPFSQARTYVVGDPRPGAAPEAGGAQGPTSARTKRRLPAVRGPRPVAANKARGPAAGGG